MSIVTKTAELITVKTLSGETFFGEVLEETSESGFIKLSGTHPQRQDHYIVYINNLDVSSVRIKNLKSTEVKDTCEQEGKEE